jgi:hypothetical protein
MTDMTGKDVQLRFPRYFKELAYGIECGSGWHKIIFDLFAVFEEFEKRGETIKVIQVKEKFGALTFHVDSDIAGIEKFIADARNRSTGICEECGAPASLHGGRGNVKTLCRDHGL